MLYMLTILWLRRGIKRGSRQINRYTHDSKIVTVLSLSDMKFLSHVTLISSSRIDACLGQLQMHFHEQRITYAILNPRQTSLY